MGKQKVPHISVVGFEKKFPSITDLRTELASIWPETEKLLDTPAGKCLVDYCLLDQSEDELAAHMKLLSDNMEAATLDSEGKQTGLARAFGIKHAICIASWGKAAFGWEPTKGGYLCFIETWAGHMFKKGQPVDTKCRELGWRQVLEVPANRGQRRMGSSKELQAVLDRAAAEVAKTLEPPRLHVGEGEAVAEGRANG